MYELIVIDPNTDIEEACYEYDTLDAAEYEAVGYEDEGYITCINRTTE